MTGQMVGYARVSSADQNLDRQIEALGEVDRMFVEKVSAAASTRPQLEELVAYVRDGDTVLVKSADRLARSTVDLLGIVERIKGKGTAVRFVDTPSLDTDSAQGSFMLTILGAVAELERAMIRERQAEGIAMAKAKGKYRREPKLTVDQVIEARARIASGASKAAVARELGVSRQTLYSALAGDGAYGAQAAA